MKFRIPIHLKAILVLLVAILIFSVVVPTVSAAIPGQLYGWYIFATLAAGAELHLVPRELQLLPHRLVELMRSAELTQWLSVPTMTATL